MGVFWKKEERELHFKCSFQKIDSHIFHLTEKWLSFLLSLIYSVILEINSQLLYIKYKQKIQIF